MNNTKNLLEHTNNKWFINLSTTVIPQDIFTLLQFDDRFCFPIHLNKKIAIHKFIKGIKSNTIFHKTNNQISNCNTAIHQFHKFLKSKFAKNVIDENLIHMQNSTKQFYDNQNIIFTRADKRNITVAMDKDLH